MAGKIPSLRLIRYRLLMRTGKKLKRGLAELSQFFSSSEPELVRAKARSSFRIEPPADLFLNGAPPKIISAGLMSSHETIDLDALPIVFSKCSAHFLETFFLTVEPKLKRYEALQSVFSIPDWVFAKDCPLPHLYSICNQVSFGHISRDLSSQWLRAPHMFRVGTEPPSHGLALAIFDLDIERNGQQNSAIHGLDILEALDHCIFMVQPDLEHLRDAFESIRLALFENPALNCSLLIVGNNAGSLWDMIYERLSEMAAKSLNCDLGFLGWVEGSTVCINPNLLEESEPRLPQTAFKAQLKSMLFPT